MVKPIVVPPPAAAVGLTGHRSRPGPRRGGRLRLATGQDSPTPPTLVVVSASYRLGTVYGAVYELLSPTQHESCPPPRPSTRLQPVTRSHTRCAAMTTIRLLRQPEEIASLARLHAQSRRTTYTGAVAFWVTTNNWSRRQPQPRATETVAASN